MAASAGTRDELQVRVSSQVGVHKVGVLPGVGLGGDLRHLHLWVRQQEPQQLAPRVARGSHECVARIILSPPSRDVKQIVDHSARDVDRGGLHGPVELGRVVDLIDQQAPIRGLQQVHRQDAAAHRLRRGERQLADLGVTGHGSVPSPARRVGDPVLRAAIHGVDHLVARHDHADVARRLVDVLLDVEHAVRRAAQRALVLQDAPRRRRGR